MRKFILASLLIHSFLSYGQQFGDSIVFWHLAPSEFEPLLPSAEQNAEALVLFDIMELKCSNLYYTSGIEIERHVRIKILNEKGLGEANVVISNQPMGGYVGSIKNIVAQSYNSDANRNLVITKMDKKSVFDRDINNRVSEKVLAIPNVRKGTVIEYSYRMSAPLYAANCNWIFQSMMPVHLSSFSIRYPNNMDLNFEPFCSLPLSKEFIQEKGYKKFTFTMKDIPAFRIEPYTSCVKDYLQRIETRVIEMDGSFGSIQRMQNWTTSVNQIAKFYEFDRQSPSNIKISDSLKNYFAKIQDPEEKMLSIFKYVRNYMEWDNSGRRTTSFLLQSCWNEKKGTSKEINLILINLLRQFDIMTYQVLVSTRDHGMINTHWPDMGQFNSVMAFVAINGNQYVLDASDKFDRPGLIPSSVNFSQGLIVEKSDSEGTKWISLWDQNQKFRNTIDVRSIIHESGVMEGDATINSYDYARSNRLAYLSQGKQKMIDTFFTSSNPNVRIDTIIFENEKSDTLPLTQKIKFSQNPVSTGIFRNFTANLFNGHETNPFISDYRFSDIFFGANQVDSITENFSLPDKYVLESSPKNLEFASEDSSIRFSRTSMESKGQLTIHIVIAFNSPFYKSSEYEQFRVFFKKILDALNEEIILKKT